MYIVAAAVSHRSLDIRSPTVFKVANAICGLARTFSEHGDEQSIVLTLYSMGSLDYPVPGAFAQQMVRTLMRKRPDSRHLTMSAWGLVTAAGVGGVGTSLVELLDLIAEKSLACMKTFTNQDCAMMAWSLWKGSTDHSDNLTATTRKCVLALATRAGDDLRELADHDLSNLATVFYNSDELPLPHFCEGMAIEVRRRVDRRSLSQQHFGSLVRFLARRTTASPEVWKEIELGWIQRHASSDPQATVSLVWAFATAGMPAWRLHGVLGGSPALTRIVEKPNGQWLANLAWGCATSEVRLPSDHRYSFVCHTIPYHTIPYHTIPYHTIPYHTIPYHTVPYHTILYHIIPYNTIPYYTIPYHTIPYHTIPYHTIPYYTIPYDTTPYDTILYYIILDYTIL